MSSKRIESLDVLRGLTVALMILVNNPGSWKACYPILRHADWNGFLLADFVFPSFLSVMGISMYISFSRNGFTLSWKVLRRTLLLLGIGLLCNWIGQVVWGGGWGLDSLRFTGVLQRFALCYGITALLVCKLPHKTLPWIAGGLLVLYGALLLLLGGYIHGPENFMARWDQALLGSHVYGGDVPDPEGLVSTIPAVAHTLLGFIVGRLLVKGDEGRIALTGAALVLAGIGLSFLMPVNKKIWSPSFVLLTLGITSLLLALFYRLIDRRHVWKHNGFWKVFCSNAILAYILGDVVAWTFDGTGFHVWCRDLIGDSGFLSLVYSVGCVLLVWLVVLPLYRRKIFIKL
jgi:predicted acyltransferase